VHTTTGQCCSCPTTHLAWSNNLCTAKLGATVSGTCVCPGQTTLISGVCGCTGGQVKQADNSCACPAGQTLVSGTCQVVVTCPAGHSSVDGICVLNDAKTCHDTVRQTYTSYASSKTRLGLTFYLWSRSIASNMPTPNNVYFGADHWVAGGSNAYVGDKGCNTLVPLACVGYSADRRCETTTVASN